MRDRAWRKWEVAGLFFVLIWGNLFHFVFEWAGENGIVGAIAAVNESVWEHVKLLVVPWVLVSFAEFLVLRRSSAVLPRRAAGLVSGMLFIPVAYYSYVGSTGSNVSIINILIFQLASLLAFGVSWYLGSRGKCRGKGWSVLGGFVLFFMLALTVVWTYCPPQLPLFTDPQTGHTGWLKGE